MLGSNKVVKLTQHARHIRHALSNLSSDAGRPISDPLYFTSSPAPDSSNGFFTASPGPSASHPLQPARSVDAAYFTSEGNTGKHSKKDRNSAGNRHDRINYGRIAAVQIAATPVGDIIGPSRSEDEDEKAAHKAHLSGYSSKATSTSARVRQDHSANIVRTPTELLQERFRQSIRNASALFVSSTFPIQSSPIILQSSSSYTRQFSTEAAAAPLPQSPDDPHVQSQGQKRLRPQLNRLSPEPPRAGSFRRRANSAPAAYNANPHSQGQLAKTVPFYNEMQNAQSFIELAGAIRMYRQQERLSLAGHNCALVNIRRASYFPGVQFGRLVPLMMELYEDMLARNIAPNRTTYAVLIHILAKRSAALYAAQALEAQEKADLLRQKDLALETELDDIQEKVDRLEKGKTSEDARALADMAFQLYAALDSRAKASLGDNVYVALLHLCSNAPEWVSKAASIFNDCNKNRPDNQILLLPHMFLLKMQTPETLSVAEDIFDNYRAFKQAGVFKTQPIKSDASRGRRDEAVMWAQMIRLYFDAGRPADAVKLFEQMLEAESSLMLPVVLGEVLTGFARQQDLETLKTWTQRILENPSITSDASSEDIATIAVKPALDILNRAQTSIEFLNYAEILSHHYPSDASPNEFLVFNALPMHLLALEHAQPINTSQIDRLCDFAVSVLKVPSQTSKVASAARSTKQLCVSLLRLGRYEQASRVYAACCCISQFRENQIMDKLGHQLFQKALDRDAPLDVLLRVFYGLQSLRVSSHPDALLPIISDVFTRALAEVYRARLQKVAGDLTQMEFTEEQWAAFTSLLGSPEAQKILGSVESNLKQLAHAGIKLGSHFAGTSGIRQNLSTQRAMAKSLLDAQESLESAQEILTAVFLPDQADAMLRQYLPPSQDSTTLEVYSEVLASQDNVAQSEEGSETATPSSPLFTAHEDVSTVSSLAHPAYPPSKTSFKSSLNFPQSASRGSSSYGVDYNTLSEQDCLALKDAFLGMPERNGTVPRPFHIIKVIARLARVKAASPADFRSLYDLGYQALGLLERNPDEQFRLWTALEDAMLVAMAHRGDLENVAVHRDRLIRAGHAPSADAYAAMIMNARDTTDDATVAVELFEESRKLGVYPNTFLFNNLLSRLSKARRTKDALEVFQQMKALGVKATSVTYGSVINACCKVGDAQTAERLFAEMIALPDFLPRVPPYNTMIQFFVSTRPDRERAVHYFKLMIAASVQPSEHTYKLLLDCYGLIKPIDVASLHDVFARLEADPNVKVQSVHWASLITSLGVEQRNLPEAIKIFDQIPRHTKDAVCYEAILNTCFANGAFDEVTRLSEEMKSGSIHSSAYVENIRIKTFAAQGDMEAARSLFKSLQDPPSGVAAMGNHPTGRRHSRNHPVMHGPVYREPSTYEAMISAEIAHGEKAQAESIFHQSEARAFPVPVVERLRNLLTSSAGRSSTSS